MGFLAITFNVGNVTLDVCSCGEVSTSMESLRFATSAATGSLTSCRLLYSRVSEEAEHEDPERFRTTMDELCEGFSWISMLLLSCTQLFWEDQSLGFFFRIPGLLSGAETQAEGLSLLLSSWWRWMMLRKDSERSVSVWSMLLFSSSAGWGGSSSGGGGMTKESFSLALGLGDGGAVTSPSRLTALKMRKKLLKNYLKLFKNC